MQPAIGNPNRHHPSHSSKMALAQERAQYVRVFGWDDADGLVVARVHYAAVQVERISPACANLVEETAVPTSNPIHDNGDELHWMVGHCHLVQFVVLSRTASRSSSARLGAGLKEATSMERSPAATATAACSTPPVKRRAVPGGGVSTIVGDAVLFRNSFRARPGGPASSADQNAVPPPVKCSASESGTRIVSDCSSRLRGRDAGES